MATISLCMIVKNEEKVLARCLESVRDAVDEIIIVDTGSMDNTKEIARTYTDKIYDFDWIDDFSAARNFSFSKAEKDFVMWLDADDVITAENLKLLMKLKEKLDNTDAVMMKYNTAFDENGNPTFSYYRERIIRRAIPHIWKGRVHEVIVYSGSTIYTEAAVNHYSVKTHYSTRNLDIYEKQLAEGEVLQPRDAFYYARELYYHKQYDKAIERFCDFISDENGWAENKIEACKILAFCYRENGDVYRAIEALSKSFVYDIPRAEICCELGNLLMNLNQYEKAAYWFETALSLPQNQSNGGFIDLNSYGYLPCIQLCVCYDKLKNYELAEEYNRRAGKYRPDSPAYLHNVNYFKTLHTSGVF